VIVLSGYIYDIFGRKFTIFCIFLAGGLALVSVPIVAPSKVGFILGIMGYELALGSL
jgi:hypothetical protein